MLRRYAFVLLSCGFAGLAGCTGTSDEGYGVPGEAAPVEASGDTTTGTDSQPTVELTPPDTLPAGGGRPPRRN